MRPVAAALALVALAGTTHARAQAPIPDRDRWVAMARGGFQVPEGRSAIDLLVEMNPLLSSPDPVLRDDVGFGAAERWILRENDRMALALHSAVRRPDADAKSLEAWVARWAAAHKALWSKGPHIDATKFAVVENAKQVMPSLHAALSMDQAPTATGEAAARIVLAGLGGMR